MAARGLVSAARRLAADDRELAAGAAPSDRARSSLRGSTTAAVLALLATTAVWGSTFVVVKDAVARMPVMPFLAWRFGIATVAMLVLRPRAVARLGPAGRRDGALLGLALGAGYVLQTYGLQSTPATVSGFVTGMFVVFTPLLAGLLLHRRVGASAWFAVVVATVGLALLSLHGIALGGGVTLTLLCAVAFAFHIVGLGEWSASYDPYGLAVVQLATVAVGCSIVSAFTGLSVPPDAGVWGALALTAPAATAVAFVVQTWAQSLLSATRAAVIMIMEPVFAAVFGAVFAGDSLSGRSLAGGALVLVAMLLVEAGPLSMTSRARDQVR